MSLSLHDIQAVSLGARLSARLETPTQNGEVLLSADLGETGSISKSANNPERATTLPGLSGVREELPLGPLGPRSGLGLSPAVRRQMADRESQPVICRGWLATSQLGRGLLEPGETQRDLCRALQEPRCPASLSPSPSLFLSPLEPN